MSADSCLLPVPKPLRYVALIAAAGVGSRAGGEVPKQYLPINGRTMLEHSIAAMLSDARIEMVFVVVAPADNQWRSLKVNSEQIDFLRVGGNSRAESVRNGLNAIDARAGDDDRVLVHDAARPCLAAVDLARLIDQVADDPRGGLLATPVTDTLKQVEDGHVVATINRDALWCAQTPQMFRVASLRAALNRQPLDGITDEASAIERSGNFPLLVRGCATNIKVTSAQDLALACAILGARKVAR